MITSRERVRLALAHSEPDRIPLDLGGCVVTGMHVSSVYKLRQALKLDEPGTPVKVIEPFQMLGEIKLDLVEALGVDVLPLVSPKTFFGYPTQGWKPWTFHDGTSVLVPDGFNTRPEADGSILMYPEGDQSVPASGHLPQGGWYFDALVRQPDIIETELKVEDNLEEFGPISAKDLDYFKQEADRLFSQTDKAILANFGGTGFGDIALVPAPWLKNPRGIRNVEEWYISTVSRRDFVNKIFERQCEIAIHNLEKIFEVVGNKPAAVFVTGTDFGAQGSSFISPKAYRQLFKPFHKQVNDWIHTHTEWKSFIHSCGSISNLLEDFIEAGFDILNPVQCSAANMAPEFLKGKFGDRITFWGGGVDTQLTLPFASGDLVRSEVRERIEVFGRGGGFVFNTIHNVQPLTPVENILAMYETVKEFGRYS